MSKYNNKKVLVDSIKFDSKDEALYYLYLKEEKEKGEVLKFILQPKLTLIPGYKKYGKSIRAMTYKPDFWVKYKDGTEEYIDVKGMPTQASKMRRKLFDYFYQDKTLRWIQRSLKYSKTDWIDADELKKIRAANKKLKKKNMEGLI